jgi:hypothetical protein
MNAAEHEDVLWRSLADDSRRLDNRAGNCRGFGDLRVGVGYLLVHCGDAGVDRGYPLLDAYSSATACGNLFELACEATAGVFQIVHLICQHACLLAESLIDRRCAGKRSSGDRHLGLS